MDAQHLSIPFSKDFTGPQQIAIQNPSPGPSSSMRGAICRKMRGWSKVTCFSLWTRFLAFLAWVSSSPPLPLPTIPPRYRTLTDRRLFIRYPVWICFDNGDDWRETLENWSRSKAEEYLSPYKLRLGRPRIEMFRLKPETCACRATRLGITTPQSSPHSAHFCPRAGWWKLCLYHATRWGSRVRHSQLLMGDDYGH
jgi:hypothetical protein